MGINLWRPGSEEANEALQSVYPESETLYNEIQKGNASEVTTSLIGN